MAKSAKIMMVIYLTFAFAATFFPVLNFQAQGIILPRIGWSVFTVAYILTAFALYMLSDRKKGKKHFMNYFDIEERF